MRRGFVRSPVPREQYLANAFALTHCSRWRFGVKLEWNDMEGARKFKEILLLGKARRRTTNLFTNSFKFVFLIIKRY